MRLTGLAMLFVVASGTGVAADQKAADACAARLSPESQEIYRTTLASKPTPETGRRIVTAVTEKMVGEGRLGLLAARPAAEAAGRCLELLAR